MPLQLVEAAVSISRLIGSMSFEQVLCMDILSNNARLTKCVPYWAESSRLNLCLFTLGTSFSLFGISSSVAFRLKSVVQLEQVYDGDYLLLLMLLQCKVPEQC